MAGSGLFTCCIWIKKKKIPVIIGFDDQWIGSFKQKIGFISFRIFNFNSMFFSHAWVAGFRQFEYARRLGFKKKQVIFDLLSCDSKLFNKDVSQLNSKLERFPKKFIYVGNFRKIKGFDLLLEAYYIYKHKFGGTWSLDVFGMGELEILKEKYKEVQFNTFTSQENLVKISDNFGVFILPSRLDQWGVVVHEFCSLGFPLLLSSNVGSKDHFLIEGFNGFSFDSGNVSKLVEKMLCFEKLSNNELLHMSINSLSLSKRISTLSSSFNFISIIE